MHPISVQIITRDMRLQKEVHHEYVVQTNHPRWGLMKIFLRAFLTLRFR
jgi:hypothetical protein